MRQAALLMVAFACASAGFCCGARLNERVRMLRDTALLLSAIRAELAYSMSSVQTILTQMTPLYGRRLPFLKACTDRLANGEAPAHAWQASLTQRAQKRALRQEDVSLLVSFGSGFGTTDLQGQLSNCEIHLALLRVNLEKAEKEANVYAKPAAVIGLLLGAGVYIFWM